MPRTGARSERGGAAAALAGLVVAANLAAITALWLHHRGYAQFGSAAGNLKGAGQLAALFGVFVLLTHLTLISRVPWLERRVGLNRLTRWHRVTAAAFLSLLAGHALLTTAGYALAAQRGLWAQLGQLVAHYPYLPQAVAALLILLAVAATSVKAIRSALGHERWWAIHLLAYAAVALAFFHQVTNGSDLRGDAWGRGYWIGLYLATGVLVVGFRWLLPIARALRHRLRVSEVVGESDQVVSVTVSGRHLERLRVQAGQFFVLRFLTRHRWWRAHPFSLSIAPDGRRLRFTIKACGDDTVTMGGVRPGTRVVAEGPYGAFTSPPAATDKVVLIAGGIGITPLRSMLESLDRPPGHVALIYRVRRRGDAVLLGEIEEIAAGKGFPVHLSLSREDPPSPNPLAPDVLRRLIPDIAERTAYICGPQSMLQAARGALRAVGVPARHIRYERFGF